MSWSNGKGPGSRRSAREAEGGSCEASHLTLCEEDQHELHKLSIDFSDSFGSHFDQRFHPYTFNLVYEHS